MRGPYTTRIYSLDSATPATVGREIEDLAQFARNAQVHVEGLGAGTYKIEYLPPRSSIWIEHVTGATASDLTILAGPDAPIFEALKITVGGTAAGSTQSAVVTVWHRGF